MDDLIDLNDGIDCCCRSDGSVEILNNMTLIHRDYPDYTLLWNTCIIHNLLYVDHQLSSIQKHSHAHIETSIIHINIVYHWGKHLAKRPQTICILY